MSNPYRVLYERELGELDLNRQNIELFQKYISDYESLKTTLATFADKSKYNFMVPVAGTDIAFMPGYAEHTNEVTVLLGDNYFAEMSTKDAAKFVERRLAFCHERLKDLEEQRKMLLNWGSMIEGVIGEKEQMLDINETETEEEHQQWLTEHRKRVAAAKRAEIKVVEKSADIPKELLDRLDELERLEGSNNELGNRTTTAKIEQNIPQLNSLSIRENPETQPSPLPPPPAPTTAPARPVSKFKASRMNRN